MCGDFDIVATGLADCQRALMCAIGSVRTLAGDGHVRGL